MKVIQNNYNSFRDNPEKITCTNCMSVIQYSKDDVKEEFWRAEGWTNSRVKYRGFSCPCCKYQIGIETLIGS